VYFQQGILGWLRQRVPRWFEAERETAGSPGPGAGA
jgi:hypothetical protein